MSTPSWRPFWRAYPKTATHEDSMSDPRGSRGKATSVSVRAAATRKGAAALRVAGDGWGLVMEQVPGSRDFPLPEIHHTRTVAHRHRPGRTSFLRRLECGPTHDTAPGQRPAGPSFL